MGYANLGVRGVSVLSGSGDSGVGGGDCKTNDGTTRVEFLPAFPASCTFLTSWISRSTDHAQLRSLHHGRRRNRRDCAQAGGGLLRGRFLELLQQAVLSISRGRCLPGNTWGDLRWFIQVGFTALEHGLLHC